MQYNSYLERGKVSTRRCSRDWGGYWGERYIWAGDDIG